MPGASRLRRCTSCWRRRGECRHGLFPDIVAVRSPHDSRKVPVEDQLGTLQDLQAHGMTRFIGLPGVSIDQLEHARTLVDIVSAQNLYNFFERWADPLLAGARHSRFWV
jgi:aryl-alcohol dehydrogenase-like predicted oxidoreductase